MNPFEPSNAHQRRGKDSVMRRISRREALVAGAAAAIIPGSALASLPEALRNHPGFRAWTPPTRQIFAPLNEFVETDRGAKRLRDWLEGRPAVLALWASWCGPCLVEKPKQAIMAQRLADAGAPARILPLQAFDTVDLAGGRRTLDRLGARNLPAVRASDGAEAAFIRLFGPSPRTPTRTVMPSLLLLDANGQELGRAVGTMAGVDGETDYWEDEATFDFLSRLR